MKRHASAFLGFAIAFAAITPSAAAYNGYVSDVRYGEHPYETRAREENKRKLAAEEAMRRGRLIPESPLYYHPFYAQRKELHPFFRKGGVTNSVTDSRLSRFRGYLDPVRAYELSPELRCDNYSYATTPYGGQPSVYRCF